MQYRVITRVLFRSLLQTARELKRPLRVRLPVTQSRAQWLDPSSPQFCFISETPESVRELFPANVTAILAAKYYDYQG